MAEWIINTISDCRTVCQCYHFHGNIYTIFKKKIRNENNKLSDSCLSFSPYFPYCRGFYTICMVILCITLQSLYSKWMTSQKKRKKKEQKQTSLLLLLLFKIFVIVIVRIYCLKLFNSFNILNVKIFQFIVKEHTMR